MKYEKELNAFLRDLIYEDWMDERDYQAVELAYLNALNTTKEGLCIDLEKGVENGYSVKYQLDLVRSYLTI